MSRVIYKKKKEKATSHASMGHLCHADKNSVETNEIFMLQDQNTFYVV